MKIPVAVTVLALAAGLWAGSARSAGPEAGGPGFTGTKAPRFSAVTMAGEAVDLDRLLKGNAVLLLNFWGLRCGACIEEMPHLEAIQKDLGGKGVRVVGVNVDGADRETLKELMEAKPLQPAYTILADPEMAVSDAFRMKGAPLTFLIDREGMVRYEHENFTPGDEKELRDNILAMLAGAK